MKYKIEIIKLYFKNAHIQMIFRNLPNYYYEILKMTRHIFLVYSKKT